MAIFLGLDTGGTYTDAVLYDPQKGILGKAKSLTTKHDLAIGLAGATEAVLRHLPEGCGSADISMVSMSTTLATNAIVERHGAPIFLILLGYDAKALERAGLRAALGGDPVLLAPGGHKPTGEEQSPLDLEALARSIEDHAPKVAAFAVSGFFSVRNPTHEIRVRQLIRDLTGKPVTCGHELTSRLDAPRRALTAALNARLIPQIQQLIQAVGELLSAKDIDAPLMVVKGDGSLIRSDVALTCPVETILSGPAASLVGALHQSSETHMLVSDMGGTTTDIAFLKDGKPVLNREGAVVGGWRTMVEAVAVHTYGLGGDSEVRIDDHSGFMVGPRRAVPLSLLSHLHPASLDTLRSQLASDEVVPYRGRFALRQRPLDAGQSSLSAGQFDIWRRLEDGPVALADLIYSPAAQRHLQRLVDRGLVVISALTPSDAAHVLGVQSHWNVQAARIGAELFLHSPQHAGWKPPASAEELCHDIMEQVVRQSGEAILDAAFRESSHIDRQHWGQLGRELIRKSLSSQQDESALFQSEVRLAVPIAAIGAPVGAYYPEVARRLRSRLIAMPHADVGNALGAVAGNVSQRAIVTITQPQDGVFRVHLPDGIRDFIDLDHASEHAMRVAAETARSMASKAGALDIQLRQDRTDTVFEQPGGPRIFMESKIMATAFGRPSLTR